MQTKSGMQKLLKPFAPGENVVMAAPGKADKLTRLATEHATGRVPFG